MTIPDLGFTLSQTYAATPERVYACFTDPELMVRWFCPNPDLPTTAELDVRPGGDWRGQRGGWGGGGGYPRGEPPRRAGVTLDWGGDDADPTPGTRALT